MFEVVFDVVVVVVVVVVVAGSCSGAFYSRLTDVGG
jgi:hypothetical protein